MTATSCAISFWRINPYNTGTYDQNTVGESLLTHKLPPMFIELPQLARAVLVDTLQAPSRRNSQSANLVSFCHVLQHGKQLCWHVSSDVEFSVFW